MRRTATDAAATRTALLTAALAVFAEQGYAAATLDQIARRADLTRGALYHHFTDKASVYLAVLEEFWPAATEPLLATLAGGDPPLDRLRRFLTAYLTAAGTDQRLRALTRITVLGGDPSPRAGAGATDAGPAGKHDAMRGLVDGLVPLLAEAHDQGQLRRGTSPSGAAVAVVCFLNGVLTTWILAPGLLDPARDAGTLTATLLEGLTA